ncbi:MAG TPA: cytochrome c3 family protein [Marinagarivorans sp.]
MKAYTLWIIWLVAFLLGMTYLLVRMIFGEQKSEFLIGDTTYGHYQIEMACETCHTTPFGGQEVLQDACTQCHAEELEAAHDSHPKSKFTDPRNADLLAIIDARYCISCHTEHKKDQTHSMGLTLPKDYCFHCHVDIGEERESHKDLAFDSCASAGCHNYHDNRALYEKFLLEHADEPWLKEPLAQAGQALPSITESIDRQAALTPADANAPEHALETKVLTEWHSDAHSAAGVNCTGCHSSATEAWIEKPSHDQCVKCHSREVTTFLAGKHGMRLNPELTTSLQAITPGESEMSFHQDSLETRHGCNSCHAAHTFNTQTAEVTACLNCHADQHSLAYLNSPHGQIWQADPASDAAVTCASCHMPRIESTFKGEKFAVVQHNQNDNLRPNEKMIRSVCLDCHGLGFAIDALASPHLIDNNFSESPTQQVPSIDWAKAREN